MKLLLGIASLLLLAPQGQMDFCTSCKRTLLEGELFANGYCDGTVLCHSCIAARNHSLEQELSDANTEYVE